MPTVKIIGAGSIGNHLAHASRSKGWDVVLTDNDPAALARARDDIYPSRYGRWDDRIALKDSRDALGDTSDIVFIGTPPDSHIPIALDILEQAAPQILVIEKPLCGPDMDGCAALWERAQAGGTFVGVGYNHVLGPNTALAEQIIGTGSIGDLITISARTREHWGGIFRAHPWLAGPQESYLGFSRRGGGAAGEHSHALNIWQHFAHVAGAGKVATVSATMDIVHTGKVDYDRLCILALETTEGLVGDVIQDVVTAPTDKSARLQGSAGHLSWHVNYRPDADAVIWGDDAGGGDTVLVPKSRPDDFKVEVDHLGEILEGGVSASPIALERGLDTMMVIAAAFKSHAGGRRVAIDWRAGYHAEALSWA